MERKYKMQTKKQLISPSNLQVALEISLSILVSLSEQRIFLIRPDFETLAFVTACSASVYRMEQLISEECPNLIINSLWLTERLEPALDPRLNSNCTLQGPFGGEAPNWIFSIPRAREL
ncbi:hypothetical protein H5410_020693 [Solanum commersonii]|uniref:Uncharacterized protein n=1 Tax=Solanum commersonii TaxID=4109 RepID=A0A9J5ZD34_SOLCO|nr:hypothetical protein H5410_020693 [Solanum commersonii]